MRTTIHKLYHKYIKKDDLYKLLDFYNQTQFWSKADLEKFQLSNLITLLKYAERNVPYYTDLFKKNNIDINSIKSLKDLSKIPFLTKEIIRSNLNTLKSKSLSEKNIFTTLRINT